MRLRYSLWPQMQTQDKNDWTKAIATTTKPITTTTTPGSYNDILQKRNHQTPRSSSSISIFSAVAVVRAPLIVAAIVLVKYHENPNNNTYNGGRPQYNCNCRKPTDKTKDSQTAKRSAPMGESSFPPCEKNITGKEQQLALISFLVGLGTQR